MCAKEIPDELKKFQVAMLPCYPGFCTSAPCAPTPDGRMERIMQPCQALECLTSPPSHSRHPTLRLPPQTLIDI